MSRALLPRLAALACLLGSMHPARAAYRVETVELPAASESSELLAVTFSPEGDLYVANRLGEIWKADRHGKNWTRFAFGLHEPLGLIVDSSRVAYVMQRPELTRIEDTDGDGVAETYTMVADHWGITGNYHEFPYGLRRDREGNFVGALGLSSGGEKEFANAKLVRGNLSGGPVRSEQQWSVVPYRGWSFKITPQGKFIPWAYGFRQPAGIGISPDGDFFSIDTQGDWIASSGLIHQQQGRFYGHPASLKWLPSGLPAITSNDDLAKNRTPYAVILPHGAVGISPGEPVWDTTQGKFGPFGGQVFIGDFSSLVSRVFMEKIDGEYQGAAFPFFHSSKLRMGNMRMAFSPDGVLYIGQASWGSGQGLQRIAWDEKPPVDIHSIRLREHGFLLRFTVPMNREAAGRAATYHLKRFRYLYHEKYGSPRIDQLPVAVTKVALSADGREAELSVSELEPGFVYEFQMEDLAAADGQLLTNPTGFYTVNRLLDGRRFTGPLTRPLFATTLEESSKLDTVAGKKTYQTYCVACHLETGRGNGASADFVGDKNRLAKSDTELIRSIRRGFEAEKAIMPPFGAVLSEQDMQNVLAYIRQAFDPLRARGR
ncbi:MAG TPA: c-type cytochrome [Opitutaceae bacterium]|nr:c-type cytochrome [Opitutaceae bacterium]